jgi:hypothetical protein
MPRSVLSRQTDPRSLYSQCEDRECVVLGWDPSSIKNRLVSALVFGAPRPSSSSKIALPTHSRRSSSQGNTQQENPSPNAYLTLVQTLKEAKNKYDLWFILGLWLKQESIREPEEFLPGDIYQRLTRRVRKRIQGISFTDMKYFELVQCWTPYFAQLLDDLTRLRHRNAKIELSRLGYVLEAIELITNKQKRSAVEVACEWLARRDIIPAKSDKTDPARTLRNAYSRINAYAKKAKYAK